MAGHIDRRSGLHLTPRDLALMGTAAATTLTIVFGSRFIPQDNRSVIPPAAGTPNPQDSLGLEASQAPGHFEAPDRSFKFDYPPSWTLSVDNNVIKVDADPSDANKGEVQITYQNLSPEEASNFQSLAMSSLNSDKSLEGASKANYRAALPLPNGAKDIVSQSFLFQNGTRPVVKFVSFFRIGNIGIQSIQTSYDDLINEVAPVFNQINSSWKFPKTSSTIESSQPAASNPKPSASPTEILQSSESGIEDVTSSLGYKFTRPKDWAAVDNDGTFSLYAPGRDLSKPGADTSPDALIGFANFSGNADKTVTDLQNAGLVEIAPVPFTNKYGVQFTVLGYDFNGSGGRTFADLAITDYNGLTYTITVYSPYDDADKRNQDKKVFEALVDSFQFTN